MRSRLLPALLALLTPLAGACGGPAYAPARELCRIRDARIREASGLAAASRAEGVLFAHNDSGDRPRFYALNRAGETLAALAVPGAGAVDWEDMAGGSDEAGRPALYLGDIGDNLAKRPRVTVYRVPEPAVDESRRDAAAETDAPARFDLVYPDGARDAEALLVHPKSGRLFLVTKSIAGSRLYAAPHPLREGTPNRLTLAARVRIPAAPGTPLPERLRGLLVTAGDISPDGGRLVLLTYGAAFEWRIPGADVAAAFAAAPARVPLPSMPQGEAICYRRDGRALLATTEGADAPVYELLAR